MSKPAALINDRERAICARVKEFREEIRWPQPAFAGEIGLSRDQLANIEYARSPLRFGIGLTICQVFDLNADWLITGRGGKHGAQAFLWAVKFKHESYSTLFSEVFDSMPEVFSPPELDTYLASDPTPGFDPQAYLLNECILWFQLNKFRTPLQAENFAREVAQFAQNQLRRLREQGASSRFRSSGKISSLTYDSLKSKTDGVKSELEKLIARVKRLASKPGAKAELARFLHVAPARVSEWLNDDPEMRKEPGGHYTLQLLKWVGQQERQK